MRLTKYPKGPPIYIEKNAFLNLILAAVETYHRECFGYLFGHAISNSRDYYYVTRCIAIQLARQRKNLQVEQSRCSLKRMYAITDRYNSLFPIIGDFHSHPGWNHVDREPFPSIEDIEDMQLLPRYLSIIIGVKKRKKRSQMPYWQRNECFGIRGSLGDFNFEINAFRLISNGSIGGYSAQALQIRSSVALRSLNTAIGY